MILEKRAVRVRRGKSCGHPFRFIPRNHALHSLSARFLLWPELQPLGLKKLPK
jgi:hypothetical protein